MENKKDNPYLSELNELIKQNRNEGVKSIVENANRLELIDDRENTLMHMAATHDNTVIIDFLYSFGFDINARNILKKTPLHVAILNRKFQAAQILLSLHADILVVDESGMSPLQFCFQKDLEVPENVIVNLLDRLKKTGLSSQQIADELTKTECSIHQVLLMNYSKVTCSMLYRKTFIDIQESEVLLKRALDADYPENVRALLRYGPGRKERLGIFLNQVKSLKSEARKKFYFERVVEWQVINKKLIHAAANTFTWGNEDDIQMYLDIGIDDYVRRNFDKELLVALIANEDVDFIKIIKKRQFNVNGFDLDGINALHMAVTRKNKEGVVYLLNNGADPNIKNCYGQTPIFDCKDIELIELLLEFGADLQIVDYDGKTFFEVNNNNYTIANICILEAKGLLKQELNDAISNWGYEREFIPYREDLEWMKTRNFDKNVSLFTLLIEDVKNMARHVKTEADVEGVLKASKERELQPRYTSMLKKKLKKSLKLHELRFKAAEFFCCVMEIEQLDHLVIERILSFLTYGDLLVFDELNIQL